MKNIVVLTGAGISRESGLKTFRDEDGLWHNHPIEQVASVNGWKENPKLVTEFYNLRRKEVLNAQPNEAHLALCELEEKYNVSILTQNIDDLHERAGSKNVIHLHGEILKKRRNGNLKDYLDCSEDICLNDGMFRPHVVLFGEEPYNMDKAEELTAKADILIVVGTSLTVYPTANLLFKPKHSIPIFYVDPKSPQGPFKFMNNLFHVQDKATIGVPNLVKSLLYSARHHNYETLINNLFGLNGVTENECKRIN